jgi:hypothetical protein
VIYEHRVVRLNYTDYCLRRQQDSVNPSSHADIMLPDFTSQEPSDFTYARVIGIYHVCVQLAGETAVRDFNFLHVRWYCADPTHKRRWRLPRISFLDTAQAGNAQRSFGFLNPAEVIRSVHIIPAYHHGLANLLHALSVARLGAGTDEEEWKLHYVGMYVHLTLSHSCADIAAAFRTVIYSFDTLASHLHS